jgi:hypothetical protein
MSKPGSRPAHEDELFVSVTDDQFEDLMDLTRQPVVFAKLWQDSMANALDDSGHEPDPIMEGGEAYDLDLYLKDGVYFELYGVQFYPSLDSEPLTGYDSVQGHLQALIATGLWLDDIGVDEDDGLVLILCRNREPLLYIPAGGWFLDEWEELPDEGPDPED